MSVPLGQDVSKLNYMDLRAVIDAGPQLVGWDFYKACQREMNRRMRDMLDKIVPPSNTAVPDQD